MPEKNGRGSSVPHSGGFGGFGFWEIFFFFCSGQARGKRGGKSKLGSDPKAIFTYKEKPLKMESHESR